MTVCKVVTVVRISFDVESVGYKVSPNACHAYALVRSDHVWHRLGFVELIITAAHLQVQRLLTARASPCMAT
jgi:hypothetical protein